MQKGEEEEKCNYLWKQHKRKSKPRRMGKRKARNIGNGKKTVKTEEYEQQYRRADRKHGAKDRYHEEQK